MKIHLAQFCAPVAIALVAAGFNSPAAVGQSTADPTAPQYTGTDYRYPVASQLGGTPYASTPYVGATSPFQQPAAQTVYPTTPQQPFYVAMNTESGAVKSPATPPAAPPAPAPQPAPQNGSLTDNGMMSAGCDCYGNTSYELGGYFEDSCNRRQWFCGIYGLAMGRDKPGNARVGLLVSQADVSAAGSYVPVPGDTVLSANDADYNFRGGVEVRFGSTFNCGSTCEYEGCCPPRSYAWLSIPGLDSVNYVIPIEDTDIPIGVGDQRILAERVRTNFSAQSFELNILRLPIFSCGPACGSDCCDGAPCGSSFSMAGMCGFRYLRLDDDFQYGMEWGVWDGAAFVPPTFNGFGDGTDNEMYYNISVDNNLAGLQLGCDMNYQYGGCWDLFWDTNFGLYNNDISSTQRVRLGDGTPVTFDNGGSNAHVHSTKDTVAFAGEMRLGGAYRINCNNRLTLAYRVVAIGGVALTTDQIPTTFDSPSYVGLIDSSGSIIMHGVQAGWERKF
jgi:Putative beta barrel porin-7 (BBP7)